MNFVHSSFFPMSGYAVTPLKAGHNTPSHGVHRSLIMHWSRDAVTDRLEARWSMVPRDADGGDPSSTSPTDGPGPFWSHEVDRNRLHT